jgi:hypothetical protein
MSDLRFESSRAASLVRVESCAGSWCTALSCDGVAFLRAEEFVRINSAGAAAGNHATGWPVLLTLEFGRYAVGPVTGSVASRGVTEPADVDTARHPGATFMRINRERRAASGEGSGADRAAIQGAEINRRGNTPKQATHRSRQRTEAGNTPKQATHRSRQHTEAGNTPKQATHRSRQHTEAPNCPRSPRRDPEVPHVAIARFMRINKPPYEAPAHTPYGPNSHRIDLACGASIRHPAIQSRSPLCA